MQKQPPFIMSLFFAYAVLAAVIALLSGQDIFRFALRAIGFAQSNPQAAIKLYYANGVVGFLLISGGLGYLASVVGLMRKEEWSKKAGFYASIVVAIGWGCIWAKVPAMISRGGAGLNALRSAMFSDPMNFMTSLITSSPVLIVLMVLSIFASIYLKNEIDQG